MIQVTIQEQTRKFNVYVGEKHVGEVHAPLRPENKFTAHIDKGAGLIGTMEIGQYETPRAAATAILDRAGYGPPISVEVDATPIGKRK